MSAFETPEKYPGVSRYRRGYGAPPREIYASSRGFFGLYFTELGREVALQAIEQRGLIGVDDPAGARDLDELGLVHLPGRAAGQGALGCRCGERVHALLRARVVDVAEVDQRTGDMQAGLLERLAPGRLLEHLIG